MGNLNKQLPIQLYVHIPFCVKKCAYCDFLSGPADLETQKLYVQALQKEIRETTEGKDRMVSTIFIGGGTPSVLEAHYIEAIMAQIKEEFLLAPDAEITIEANPGTFIPKGDLGEKQRSLSREKLQTYKRAGINRLSMGLQSPKDEELKLLGRIHNVQQFLECYYGAREEGFQNINIDLMSALPGQTYESWMENLEYVAKLDPEHISAYSLIVEEGTPFAKMQLELPDEDTEYRMYEDTAKLLARYGYKQYEISNYARPGYESRHNSGYWTRKPYLGFGLGASSLWENIRFSNVTNMKAYLENSGDVKKIRENIEQLTEEEQMAEFMFLGLRMNQGISIQEFYLNFGKDIFEVYGDIIEKHKKIHMLKQENGRIFLTREGIHLSNSIMSDFLI